MGLMIDGIYHAEDPAPDTTQDGRFQRQKATIRNWITREGPFTPDPGRYHLYAAWNCPWAHRALLIRVLKGLEDTITVAYRSWRGEPRGKHRKGADADQLGDCIDCMACVNVCPVGIDIRDGQQLECITCALCIDACDDIMKKIGKPRGLIDYMALTDEANERGGTPKKSVWKHIFRLRTIIYTVLWSAIGIGLTVMLFVRSDIDVTISPVRNPQYVTLSDGTIRNTYDVRIRNMQHEDTEFHISLTSHEILRVELEGTNLLTVTVPADSTQLQRVYVLARPDDPAATAERTDFRFWIEAQSNGSRTYGDTVFHGQGN